MWWVASLNNMGPIWWPHTSLFSVCLCVSVCVYASASLNSYRYMNVFLWVKECKWSHFLCVWVCSLICVPSADRQVMMIVWKMWFVMSKMETKLYKWRGGERVWQTEDVIGSPKYGCTEYITLFQDVICMYFFLSFPFLCLIFYAVFSLIIQLWLQELQEAVLIHLCCAGLHHLSNDPVENVCQTKCRSIWHDCVV